MARSSGSAFSGFGSSASPSIRGVLGRVSPIVASVSDGGSVLADQ
jgi:hypothetical protein